MQTVGPHFTDYRVLEAENAEELSKAVVQAIHNHWQPYGDMAVARSGRGTEERVVLLQPVVQLAEWYR